VLWIDAICTNQKDNDEKSEHVQMMDAIFNGANTVRIWLGDTAEDSDEAIDFID